MLRKSEYKLEDQLELFLVEVGSTLNIIFPFSISSLHPLRCFLIIDYHLNHLQKLGELLFFLKHLHRLLLMTCHIVIWIASALRKIQRDLEHMQDLLYQLR